ncbi:MAG: divalent-cation tolerance protein CutA [Zoogloeaceae bacterium]|jgi:periplasmic divalent cation tolerance protein|nr:divalent-cation tolerance protein CutA [Zoogloeaceae bacterium]
MTQACLVFTSLPDEASAFAVSEALIERRLAVCVSRLPGISSTYRWEGKIERAEEVALIIKTTQEQYPALEKAIIDLHPYDLPEILAVPVSQALPAYLTWMGTETV